MTFCGGGKTRNCLPQPPRQEFPAWAPHPSGKAAWLLPMLQKRQDLSFGWLKASLLKADEWKYQIQHQTAHSGAELSKAFQNLCLKLDLLQNLALQSSAALHPAPTSAERASSFKKKAVCCFLKLLITFCRASLLCSISSDLPKTPKKSDYGAAKQHPRVKTCSSGGRSRQAHSHAWGRAPAAAPAWDSEARSPRDGGISRFSPASHFFPISGHRHLKATIEKKQRNCTNTEKTPYIRRYTSCVLG